MISDVFTVTECFFLKIGIQSNENTHVGVYFVLLVKAYVTLKKHACPGLSVSMETKL